jgi:hypothetical protein
LLSVRQPVDTFFTERDKNLPAGDLELREQRAIPDFRQIGATMRSMTKVSYKETFVLTG